VSLGGGEAMMVKNYAMACLVVFLAACARVPASAPSYQPVVEAPGNTSNLYIYRYEPNPRKLRIPTIYVDGVEIFDPPERAYTVIRVPAGDHSIKVHWPWDTAWPELTVNVVTQAGQDAYFRIGGTVTREDHLSYRVNTYGNLVDASTGKEELRDYCRYMPPKGYVIDPR
jgi:hypothetical protein